MPSAYIVVLLLFSIQIVTIATRAAARDTVSPERPLVGGGGGKLISNNGKFALGFFQTTGTTKSSGNISAKWYMGIWFNTVPKFTPVWVANRENPLIHGASSELMISDDGNLVIFNRPNRSVLWSSQANTMTNNTVAVLLNTGNLVLSDASNLTIVFWESFNHMTDTILPGAKMGWNKRTGWVRGLVSNKNLLDPAPGVYSGRPIPDDTATNHSEFTFLWNFSVAYWSSGQWNGLFFNNMPEISGRLHFTYEFVSNDQEVYFTYRLRNDTMMARYVLDVFGRTKAMIWSDASKDWISLSSRPGAQCDVYAVCGPFTICIEDMLRFCSCIKGFSIKSPEDWELGDRTGGCERNIPLNCGSNQSRSDLADKFYGMSDVRFPDNSKYLEIASSGECAQACVSDCSCYAYSFHDGCYVWNSELLNVAQKNSGSSDGRILYLRLAAKELETSRHRREMKIRLLIAAASSTFTLFAIVTIFIWRKKTHSSATESSKIRGGVVAFRYKDLHHATKGFTERLGGGSFGSVFKGVLPDSTVIAVKMLDSVRQGEKEFRAEVRSIGVIQHINVVKLIGFCCEGNKRLLVYEYMTNSSLDTHLFQSNCTSLSWSTRCKIALGIARGLAYLHEHCQECIIHCDIKPQNVLLDALFVPKIADFGMAKFVARDFSRALTTMRGTVGYLAPEWISGVPISPKVDVYSYGMVLLEIIFGRRNLREEYTSDATYFPVTVMGKLIKGNVQCLVEQNIQDAISLKEVERACRVACWCIQDDESDRPTMEQVAQILEGLLDVGMPPIPKLLQAVSDGTNYFNA